MSRWERKKLQGWGRLTQADVSATYVNDSEQILTAMREVNKQGVLAYGNGRSYGDIALNTHGQTLLMRGFSKRNTLDSKTGLLICDPGVTFHELLRKYLPLGFLVPVTPGTGYATIGGAVANDVHGKNHDVAGSFGNHVLWLDLLLPNGDVTRVNKEQSPALFAATIAGMGLTGVILTICIKMQRVSSNAVLLQEELWIIFLKCLNERALHRPIQWVGLMP